MHLTKHFELRLLWPFYLGNLMQAVFVLTAAYWVVYFLSLGHSLATISLLPLIMLFTSLALEIPTGFIADLKGRKVVVLTAIFLEAIVVALIPLFGSSFGILLLLYALIGVGSALASGASEAWVVDLLHAHAKPHAIAGYYATLHSIINIGFIASPLLASLAFFLTNSYHILWWIQGGVLFSVGLLLLVFGKEKRHTHTSQEKSKRLLVIAFSQFKENTLLRTLVGIMTLFALLFGLTTLAWQPFLLEIGVPPVWFGVIFAFTGLFAITYPFFQKRLEKIRNEKILQYLSLIQMISLILLAFLPFAGILFLFFLIQNLDSLKLPIFQPWFQDQIPSSVRSTLGSILALAGAFGEGAGYLIAGQLSEALGLSYVWWFAAGISGILVVLFSFARKKS